MLAQEGGPPAAAVVVDDGCPYPETSRTALSMAAAHPGRVFALRRPNGGLSAARNTGIEFALAAFPALRALFCLDADNRLHPRFLCRASAALDAAPPEVGWLYPDIDEIGRPQNFTTGGDFSLLMLLAENYCDAGSLMRRELVDRGLRFDERMRAGFEDWDFWLQAAGLGFVGRHLPGAGFLYRRRPESMLSEAERRRPALLRDLHAKHARLLRPQRLLELEAAEAPRYALFSPERPGMRLALDPAREAVAHLDPAAARERLLAALESMETVHLPPVLVFAADAALDLLRAHGLVRNLFWLAEARLRDAEVVAVEIAPGEERDEAAIEALPVGDAGASDVVMLRGRNLGGLSRAKDIEWLESLATQKPEPKLRRMRVSLPGVEAATAGQAAFRHLVSEVEALRRARRHRTALKPGWREDFRNWRDNVAERAYGFSGLGAVLPLLPEPGRRSFGFVLPLFALGGVERVVLRQAAALRERGWRPHLFVLGEQRVALSAAARENFESVNLLFGMGETDSDWKNAHFGAEVAAFGKGTAAADALGLLAGMDAVLNTHSLPAHALMARLKGIGVRTFCGLHLVERTPWGNPLGTAHTALAYEHAYGGITVISEKLRRWCVAQGVPAGKLHLIRNAPGYRADPARVSAAVAARRERRPPGGKLRALFLGRLDGQKGLDRLAAVVARTQHRVEWRVVGRAVLDRPVDLGLALEPPATTPAQLDALYAWADAVLLPSRFEGVPLIVLEAQRFGCAVVATDVGATGEAIEHGVDGFLVPHDLPEPAVANAMGALLLRLDAEPELLAGVAAKAAARIARAGAEDGMRGFLDHLDPVVPGPLR